jgi:hypothetical protein
MRVSHTRKWLVIGVGAFFIWGQAAQRLATQRCSWGQPGNKRLGYIRREDVTLVSLLKELNTCLRFDSKTVDPGDFCNLAPERARLPTVNRKEDDFRTGEVGRINSSRGELRKGKPTVAQCSLDNLLGPESALVRLAKQ